MVAQFKRILGRPKKIKIGHLGTLDPFAQGLLMIGIGGALRVNEYFNKTVPKTYRCVGILGQKTNTGDCEGEIVEESPYDGSYSESQIENMIQELVGPYLQKPPAYSAAKHEGKPLYYYAQKGIEIEKPPKIRHIHSLKVLSLKGNLLELLCEVSSGTYIRTLFEDVARLLGSIGHLKELERVAIGPFHVDQSFSLDDVETSEALLEKALGVDRLLDLPPLILEGEMAKKYSNGVALQLDLEPGQYWVKGPEGKILGLALMEDELLKSQINFS